jgi:rhamnosyl/mannosyltransferase
MENHLYHLASRLRHHVELRVVVSNNRCRTVHEVYEGVEVVRLARQTRIAGMPISTGLIGELRRTRADVIHLHVPNPMAELACLLARPRGAVISTVQHDTRERRLIWPAYLRLSRAFLSRNVRIIAAAPQNIDYSLHLRPFHDRCVVIPLGIEPADFAMTPSRRRQVEAIRARFGPRIVLFMGRHVHSKGVHVLVEAMRRVDAHLLLGSSGPFTGQLKEMTRRLGIEERVTFLGNVDDAEVANWFNAADVFCLPSINRLEAFGIVQLEAMACGVPVVSTRLTTGVVYVNLDGETGLTVPPGDVDALASALNRLLDDEDLRRRLGRQAKERVLREFTHDINLRRTLALYHEVLARRRTRRGR